MVLQLKGKKHIRYIRRKALRLWEGVNREEELRNDCLREILERHRKKLHVDLQESRKKIVELTRESPSDIQEEFSYPSSQCDNNGWVG